MYFTHPPCYVMITSSNGNMFRVTGPLYSPVTGEFPSQRLVRQSFDVLFDLHLNKRLSKQSRRGDLRHHRAHYEVTVMVSHENAIMSTLCLFIFSAWFSVLGPRKESAESTTKAWCDNAPGERVTGTFWGVYKLPCSQCDHSFYFEFRGRVGKTNYQAKGITANKKKKNCG